jgi:hypothetical protein
MVYERPIKDFRREPSGGSTRRPYKPQRARDTPGATDFEGKATEVRSLTLAARETVPGPRHFEGKALRTNPECALKSV